VEREREETGGEAPDRDVSALEQLERELADDELESSEPQADEGDQ
jgi:hypothetical protein